MVTSSPLPPAQTPLIFFNDFIIELSGVVYIAGHLTWHWNHEFSDAAIALLQPGTGLPILQDDCFLIEFQNNDLQICPLVLMAKSIRFSVE